MITAQLGTLMLMSRISIVKNVIIHVLIVSLMVPLVSSVLPLIQLAPLMMRIDNSIMALASALMATMILELKNVRFAIIRA